MEERESEKERERARKDTEDSIESEMNGNLENGERE